ncbi:MAG: YgjP-like metallopeptidase domain-containing protein [Bacteroidales bacterium]
MQKEFIVKAIGKVTITKRRNSKNFRMTVKPPASIQVSIPYYTSYKSALRFVENNQEWVEKKMAALQKQQPQTQFQKGNAYQTAFHSIHFLETPHNKWHYQQEGTTIKLFAPGPFQASTHHPHIQSFIIEVLRKEAKSVLPAQVYRLAKQFDLPVNKVFIKNLRSIWGSCSGLNNINLNLHLMRLPEDLRQYVICHELAHLKVRNHSAAFWAYLETLFPGAREKARELRHYTTRIL